MSSRSKTVDVNSLFDDVGESKAELAELTKYGAELKNCEPFRGEKLLGWIDRSKGNGRTVEPIKEPKIEEQCAPKRVQRRDPELEVQSNPMIQPRTKEPVRDPKNAVEEQPSTSSQKQPRPCRPEAAVIDFESNVDAQVRFFTIPAPLSNNTTTHKIAPHLEKS